MASESQIAISLDQLIGDAEQVGGARTSASCRSMGVPASERRGPWSVGAFMSPILTHEVHPAHHNDR